MKLIASLTIVLCAPTTYAFTVDTVPIRNPGNSADTTNFGAVAYEYRIGKFEVSIAQYTDFLNAVAAADPLQLYDSQMAGRISGGIVRSGASGGYAYSLKTPQSANKPVSYVSWFDAVRFVNWLSNGQGGPGSTEYGSYTLEGGTPIPSNAVDVVRNVGAVWILPSADEWYKAAYYDPNSAAYFNFATSSNSVPTSTAPPGNPNSAAFDNPPGAFTDVGAYSTSPSPFGTFDQAGNVEEWNESWASQINNYRFARGGDILSSGGNLFKSHYTLAQPQFGSQFMGFRVALVPEPSTPLLVLIALAAGPIRRRKSVPHNRV